MHVHWSRLGSRECIRLSGLGQYKEVQVRPASAYLATAPPMAGCLIPDGEDVCFVPRFPFVDGTTYTVAVQDAAQVQLVRPAPPQAATTEVIAIYPTAGAVPQNLLRYYVWFSAPMSEGYADTHVRLVDAAGEVIAAALLATEHELWDRHRRRLTVLLDPARIKRGLLPHRQTGYPLQTGDHVRLVIDDGFRDAAGQRLRSTAERSYRVGENEQRRVDPATWTLSPPAAGTDQPLQVTFDRPLDHGLLTRCLHVTGPDSTRVTGTIEVGLEERTWRLTPRRPWTPGPHRLDVDPTLEDLAGNSVRRLFDQDLTHAEDQSSYNGPVTVSWSTAAPW